MELEFKTYKFGVATLLFFVVSLSSVEAFQLPKKNARSFLSTNLMPSSSRSCPTATVLKSTDMGDHPDSLELSRGNNPLVFSKSVVDGADDAWRIQSAVDVSESDRASMNRRLFMGAALLGTSSIIAPENVAAQDTSRMGMVKNSEYGKLGWESTPVNKRTGVTVFDAEKAGYNVRFVTYLSRFLLVFDADCQKWWYSRAADIPRRATAQEVDEIRLKQFGAFSASVEVGLQEYRGPDGPAKLMRSLLIRYCPTIDLVQEKRARRGLPSLTEDQESKERREIKEARRQIALLFGLMETNQPVEEINKLLAAIDNGSIASIKIENGGSGYAPGYGPPLVTFPPPKAGKDYKTATGRATLEANGKILRLDLVNRGFGYQKPPSVTISAPGADRGVEIPGGRTATAKAIIFTRGVNKGRLDRIQIEDEGDGYMEGEKIKIMFSLPELPFQEGGVTASAQAILEFQVASIEIVDGGSGYAVEKPIPVTVEPPPLTARVNMNDPLTARIVDPTKPLPLNPIPAAKLEKMMPDPDDPNSVPAMVNRMAKNDGKGGGGGCIGRACYDKPVVAFATAQAEISSFSAFRNEKDALVAVEQEAEILKNYRVISATNSGSDSRLPAFWNGPPTSSSAQLLTLLPAGFGLEYESNLKRFALSAGPNFVDVNKEINLGGSNRPLDPEFGPRGRSPIERDLTLNLGNFLRFCASGAICASGVHLVLTPLDVVKTKIQTDPEKYPGLFSTFKKLVNEDGITGFFVGWVPTTIGFFCWGAVSYSITELIRRYLNDYLGPQAVTFEVPVVLTAAAISSFVSVFFLCPFEAVRIRSVAQPDYGAGALDISTRMIKVCLRISHVYV